MGRSDAGCGRVGPAFAQRAVTLLVVDASTVVAACLAEDGWTLFREESLVVPPLAVSEACSALHESQWRGELPGDEARRAVQRLAAAPLTVRELESPAQAWAVADELGWAKTYDAEYVALARSIGYRLVTLDERLRRGVRGLVEVVGPAEL